MKYNNQWLIEKYLKNEGLEYLFFWGHQPSADNSITKTCFSQWWAAPFVVEDIAYKTAEHWMMAAKARLFKDEMALDKIVHANTPAEAKKLGRTIKNFDPAVWDTHKFEIVVAGNLYKFSQHADLKKFLLNTGNRVLVEASPVDAIWGIGMDANNPDVESPFKWRGENLLSYALMEVRDQLNME
jgi:ribA/ribD-fused uncharacterized protein